MNGRKVSIDMPPQLISNGFTGLLNRQDLRDALNSRTLYNNTSAVALIVLELARFDVINISSGIEKSDQIVNMVAKRLLHIFPDAAAIAQLDRCRFAIAISNTDELAGEIDRLLDFIQRPMALSGKITVVDVILGVVTSDTTSDNDADSLLQAAKAALYTSKLLGVKVAHFEKPMLLDAQYTYELEYELRSSRMLDMIDLHSPQNYSEFELFYQPIVDIFTEQVYGFEALLRWNHPTRGKISPAMFTLLAEKLGLMAVLGHWVIRRAMTDAASWPANSNGTYPLVSINLSGVQLNAPEALLSSVSAAIVESGLAPERVNFEIVETAQLSQQARFYLRALTDMGCTLALDDFGTGFSSIDLLESLPLRYVKLDMSLVKGLMSKDENKVERTKRLIKGIIALTDSFDLISIIEGIEDTAGIEITRDLGAKLIQGFVYSGALSQTDARSYVSKVSKRA